MRKKTLVGITALVFALLNGAVFYVANAAGTSTTISSPAYRATLLITA